MYELRRIDQNEAYFHASWRRAKPLGSPADFTIIDGIKGAGAYVGTYLAIQPNMKGWWGEGEVKFYMDGDKKYPTICGTGTEDYFGGAWNFDVGHRYIPYTTAYLGLPQVTPPDHIYTSYQRFGAYRWHLRDPIRFSEDLKVTIQAISAGDEYRPLVDADIAAMSVWYQNHPNRSPQRSLVDESRRHGYANVAEYLKVDPMEIPRMQQPNWLRHLSWIPRSKS
jgi:hypothetical protein